MMAESSPIDLKLLTVFITSFSFIDRKLSCNVRSSVPVANSASGSDQQAFKRHFQSRNYSIETIYSSGYGEATDISVKILKNELCSFVKPFDRVFYRFLNGNFPKILKMGTITPS